MTISKSSAAALLAFVVALMLGVCALVANPVDPQGPVKITNRASATTTLPPPAGESRGCVVRLPDTGPPYIHTNTSHDCPLLISTTGGDNGRLVVKVRPGFGPVQGFVCDEDESLTARGIMCGASGGLGPTELTFYDTTRNRVVPWYDSRVTCDFCNVWLIAVHSG